MKCTLSHNRQKAEICRRKKRKYFYSQTDSSLLFLSFFTIPKAFEENIIYLISFHLFSSHLISSPIIFDNFNQRKMRQEKKQSIALWDSSHPRHVYICIFFERYLFFSSILTSPSFSSLPYPQPSFRLLFFLVLFLFPAGMFSSLCTVRSDSSDCFAFFHNPKLQQSNWFIWFNERKIVEHG